MEKHKEAHDIFAPSRKERHLAGDWTRPVGELLEDSDEKEED